MSRLDDRPKILTLLGAFWPGSDSSGPNLSFKALAETLSHDYRFYQVSRDRPFGASQAIAESGRWIDRRFAEARYCQPTRFGARGLTEILRTTPHDVLLLNGFHDQDFTIPALVLRRLGLVPARPTILSPRGEFAAGAGSLKAGRKRLYRKFARRTGLLDDVWLHATSEIECEDIRSGFPWAHGYLVAPNVRELVEPLPHQASSGGTLRLVFVGRISPVKNLDYALRVLARVTANVELRIYGPVQDQTHWRLCETLIADLPANVRVVAMGEIANADMPKAYAEADMLFLPTQGENFGHAIFEALSCGVPVLVSDQTPWRNLEMLEAGYDLPLANPDGFAAVIDNFAALNAGAREALRQGARRLAERSAQSSNAVARSRAMIETALGRQSGPSDVIPTADGKSLRCA